MFDSKLKEKVKELEHEVGALKIHQNKTGIPNNKGGYSILNIGEVLRGLVNYLDVQVDERTREPGVVFTKAERDYGDWIPCSLEAEGWIPITRQLPPLKYSNEDGSCLWSDRVYVYPLGINNANRTLPRVCYSKSGLNGFRDPNITHWRVNNQLVDKR